MLCIVSADAVVRGTFWAGPFLGQSNSLHLPFHELLQKVPRLFYNGTSKAHIFGRVPRASFHAGCKPSALLFGISKDTKMLAEPIRLTFFVRAWSRLLSFGSQQDAATLMLFIAAQVGNVDFEDRRVSHQELRA